MDHTIALIQKSHEGDEEARAQIVEEDLREGDQSWKSCFRSERLDY